MDGGWNGPKPQPKAASRVGARGGGVRPPAPSRVMSLTQAVDHFQYTELYPA